MSAQIIVKRIGPGSSVQDMGRRGYLAQGLSRGGAADRFAMLEGAVLLGQPTDCAALELTAAGGAFAFTAPARIALTGAPMRARLGDRALVWNAAHEIPAGEVLTLGPAQKGVFAYLHVGGGFDVPPQLGSRSAHLALALGCQPATGDSLPVGPDGGSGANRVLDVDSRFGGGEIRILPGPHTALFPAADRVRFEQTEFTRDTRGNRQGVRLDHVGAPFATSGQLDLVSEAIVPGDIQMTGEGTPFVLLPECQTTGGYPRIGTVLPDDLPRVAQAAPGDILRFRFVTLDEAMSAHRSEADRLSGYRGKLRPLVRDPADIPDLLSYQLISGAITGREGD